MDTVIDDTKHGNSNNHDYRRFQSSLSGLHAKEKIYQIQTSHLGFQTSDLEITVTDVFNRGLDAFIMENCGAVFGENSKKRSASIIHLSMDALQVSTFVELALQVKADELKYSEFAIQY